jgi:integrase
VDRILTTEVGMRWEAFLALGIAIGARRAELLALNWSDVADKKVTISKAMSQITGAKPFVKGTKTGSVRPVPLAAIPQHALRKQRIRQKEERLAAGPAHVVDRPNRFSPTSLANG